MSRLVSILTACALCLAIVGCKGGKGGSAAKAEYRDVIAKCVRLMTVDLEAVKDRHPELSGWQPPARGARRIDFANKAGGILVTISRPAEKKAAHEFPNLGLAAFVEVTGSEKFKRAAREIVSSRLVPLRDLDAAAGKSVKGLVAELAAAGKRHPELAGVGNARNREGRLDYLRGGLQITVWADLAPTRPGDVRCFPLCARAEGGSSALRKEILAIIDRNLEPLRELEKRTGGWRAR